MAECDSLLKLIGARGAESLCIVADGVPELVRGGIPAPLSMPPLSSIIVGNFLSEIGGPSTTTYSAATGEAYDVVVEGAAPNVRITFRPAAAFSPPQAPQFDLPPKVPAQAAPAPARPSFAPSSLDAVLTHARSRDASDIILSANGDAWMRVSGRLRPIEGTAFTSEQILESLGVDEHDVDAAGSLDFAIEREQRYRVNVFRQAGGVAAALRPIRSTAPSLQSLHLPPAIASIAEERNGLVLVAGAAGSGKSTTLAALIEYLNQRYARHIITLEDPIEYRYTSQQCLIHQREVGTTMPSFASGLRAALRESPDVILVGELRDRETISAAITAAETGHLVLGTIHASSAATAIDRVIDVFPGESQRQIRHQLAMVVKATLTQFLVESPLPPGRMPAIELMRTTSAVAAHIREDKTHQLESAIQTGRNAGMIPLELSLARLVHSGRVDRSEAESLARDPSLLGELLRSGL